MVPLDLLADDQQQALPPVVLVADLSKQMVDALSELNVRGVVAVIFLFQLVEALGQPVLQVVI